MTDKASDKGGPERVGYGTYQRKLSLAVPSATVHDDGPLVGPLRGKTQALMTPVTFGGAVPLRYSWGCAIISVNRLWESKSPTCPD